MRRYLATAIIAGLALGGSLNLLVWPHQPPTATEAAVSTTVSQSGASKIGPASHGNSNTGRPKHIVGLNPNVIEGKVTRVCTSDSDRAFQQLVKDAVEHWNNALAALDFDVFELTDSTAPDACDGDDIHLVVSQSPIGDNCSRTARACHDPHRKIGEPRVDFSNGKQSKIYYQVFSEQPDSMSHLRTMVHELGHALGIGHYERTDRCSRLRNATVDPQGDHFSVMVGSLPAGAAPSCGAQAAITGRDLRDFFEAYHVGAITNVNLEWVALDTTTQEATVRLAWGTDGIEEASHGGTFVLLRRNDGADAQGDTIWSVVRTLQLDDGHGSELDLEFDVPQNKLGSEYQLRVMSKALVGSSSAAVLPGEHLGLTLEQHSVSLDSKPVLTYRQGYPTYLRGLDLYSPPTWTKSRTFEIAFSFEL